MRHPFRALVICGLVLGSLAPTLRGQPAGEVAIYTGTTQWITKALADEQAQICEDTLAALGITALTRFQSDTDMELLADWVIGATDNGQTDVLVLYGDIPPTIYAQGNLEPDGSIAETFIETTDGDAIINHADYMFWGLLARNEVGGLENMMDIPGIVMWDDNTPMEVTAEGKTRTPSLTNFMSDRPFHLDQLPVDGTWQVELALAQNAAGTRADPVIVRDGDLGRLIPVCQTADGNEPKGAVAAEIIAYLFNVTLPTTPIKLNLTGQTAAWVGNSVPFSVQLQGQAGPVSALVPWTVNLTSDSASGRFDTAADGLFDGSVTSVTIPVGERGASFFYKDTAAGAKLVTTASGALTPGALTVKLFVNTKAPAGEVAVYTGATQWITKPLADEQAQICLDKLNIAGIVNTWFPLEADADFLAEWVQAMTGNGKLDVLVLYGDIPPAIYAGGNTQPDGSLAELFIESEDGDAIMNHADYMFWGLGGRNQVGGLENMMDIPGVVMWDDNTPMTVTEAGLDIAPSLTDFMTDRPFHLDQLAGDWLVEASLAQNAAGTRADPIIVQDGTRGRLIPVFQTADGPEPKGAVAAEIIFWLFGVTLPLSDLTLSGPLNGVTGTPGKYTIKLLDEAGSPRPSPSALTVNLSSDSPTGRFDTQWSGSYDGSVTSVTIPAGERSATFFHRETAAGLITLSVDATGLTGAEVQVNVVDDVPATQGEVLIYTGVTQWVDKAVADTQAQICSNALTPAGITNTVLANELDTTAVLDWVQNATGNGSLDVLVLYGDFPPTIYEPGNLVPDGSPAELFIESTDGDVIINHADYMFWGLNIGASQGRNSVGGLENMMDIPGIVMWDDNTPMVVTGEGAAISPTLGALGSFLTDRPFHLDQMAGEWFSEVSLAENTAGTRAEPIIVRDGNRGRLIPIFQSAFQDDPKGAVAAEVIIWLMQKTGPVGELFRRGDTDGSKSVNITDMIRILNFLFAAGPRPTCQDTADTDDSGGLNITDGIYGLNFLFAAGRPIPPPGTADCGPDPTADALPACVYDC